MILHWQMKMWRDSKFGAQTGKEMVIDALGTPYFRIYHYEGPRKSRRIEI
jgi:hypothetical protein